jgi:hypothetical protein
MVWSRGGDVVAVNSWQSRFGIVLIVVLSGNKHENDPEAGSPNTYPEARPASFSGITSSHYAPDISYIIFCQS